MTPPIPPRFQDHRAHIEALFRAALLAADPGAAVRRHWPQAEIESFPSAGIVAIGKASLAMARAAADLLGPRLRWGLVVSTAAARGDDGLDPRLAFAAGGHPMPDPGSLQAGRLAADRLARLSSDDLVLVLLSGGGSALFELLNPGLELADLQALTTGLLRCGAPIQEVNCVRKHISQVKGGGLARLAAPARVVTLVLSDVMGDPLDVIASGPTVPDPTTIADARQILANYGLTLPRIEAALAETPKPGAPVFERVTQHLIGSNTLARQAAAQAARELGFEAALPALPIEGEARDLGRRLARQAKDAPQGWGALPRAEIYGGESTVTVHGHGLGGRNQELALAAALELQSGAERIAIASLGTDGIDGPTPAAGAVVTSDTARQAAALGLDLAAALADNDSHTALTRLQAAVVTGPTGTNVNDLVFVLRYRA